MFNQSKNLTKISVTIGKNDWRWWNYAFFLLYLSPERWYSDTNWAMHSLTPDSNSLAWHAIRFASLHCRYFSPPNLPPMPKERLITAVAVRPFISWRGASDAESAAAPHVTDLIGAATSAPPFSVTTTVCRRAPCVVCAASKARVIVLCQRVSVMWFSMCAVRVKPLWTRDEKMTRCISDSCTNKDANFCTYKRELERILRSTTDAESVLKLRTNERKGVKGKMNKAEFKKNIPFRQETIFLCTRNRNNICTSSWLHVYKFGVSVRAGGRSIEDIIYAYWPWIRLVVHKILTIFVWRGGAGEKKKLDQFVCKLIPDWIIGKGKLNYLKSTSTDRSTVQENMWRTPWISYRMRSVTLWRLLDCSSLRGRSCLSAE